MQKPKTNHICLISIGQKRTFKSGHSRSKLKCCLTFSNSRHHCNPLRDQKPPWPLKHICHESIPKQEANACGTNSWQVISFMKRGYLDTKAATPQTCPGSFSIVKPAFEQVSSIWGLRNSSCQFSLKLLEAKKLYKKAYLFNPKERHTKTYSIKYIFSPASGKVT